MEVDPVTPPSPEPLIPKWEKLISDTFYIETDQDYQNLLNLCANKHPEAPVFLIRHPNDFDDHKLLRQVILPESDEGGEQQEQEGLIYSEKELVLLIDTRQMGAGNLAELNELFDQVPTFQGRALGKKCKCVVMVNKDMHIELGGSSTGKARGDFWRRQCKSTHSWTLDGMDTQAPLKDIPVLETTQQITQNDWIIDFQFCPDWRALLFGKALINAGGKAIYQPGVLHGVENQETQRKVVLKNAPWGNPDFELAIMELRHKGYFVANGRQISTGSLNLHQLDDKNRTTSQPHTFFQWGEPADASMFIINEDNFEECLATAAVINNRGIIYDTLADILQNHSGLRVSSKLSEEQWHRLEQRIGKLQQKRRLSGPVKVCTDAPAEQPLSIRDQPHEQMHEQMLKQVAVYRVDFPHHETEQLCHNIMQKQKQEPFLLTITPDLSLHDIVGDINIASIRRRTFETKASGFYQALQCGQPIIINNLTCNQKLQNQLEGLLQRPCCLIINGKRYSFPKAQIYVIRANSRAFQSPVWTRLPTSNRVISQWSETLLDQYGLDKTVNSKQCLQLNTFLECFHTVSSSSRRLWPFPHPQYCPAVLKKVLKYALHEQELWQLDTLTQECWRQAIKVAIINEYQGHDEVYAFLQQMLDLHFPPDPSSGFPEPSTPWVDQTCLKAFLQQHNYEIDLDILKSHFWQLSRAVNQWPAPATYPNKDFTRTHLYIPIARALVACCPEVSRKLLSQRLRLSNLHKSLPPDFDRAQCAQSIQYRKTQRYNATQQPEAMEDDNSNSGLHSLVDDLQRTSISNPALWEKVRERELMQALDVNNIVVLKGEAGSGKSYTANVVASKLAGNTTPVIINPGPQSNQSTLLRSQKAVHVATLNERSVQALNESYGNDVVQALYQLIHDECDSENTMDEDEYLTIELTPACKSRIKKRFPLNGEEIISLLKKYSDIKTVTVEGPILQWARQSVAKGESCILIIDEANLAPPELWAIFQGLASTPPYITYKGERVVITRQHKVIMTGNTEKAPGRSLPASLRHQAVTLFYQPLPRHVLQHSVLGKSLTPLFEQSSHPGGQKERAIEQILLLWEQYQVLLPDHELTARDLHEICDLLTLWLQNGKTCVSDQVLSELIWKACHETLAGGLPPDRQKLDSLYIWYQIHGGICAADAAPNIEQQVYQLTEQEFDQFYRSLPFSSTFTFEGEATRALAKKYWQVMKKNLSEVRKNQLMPGKHALLVEGPPGRGKDELWRHIHNHMVIKEQNHRSYIHMNAGLSHWDDLKEIVREAAESGNIVVISEVNRIPSQYLEEFNDLLTGHAHPGFLLIGTINPHEFAGREVFSPALYSRFVRHRIGDYSDSDLLRIAKNRTQLDETLATSVTRQHCTLRAMAIKSGCLALPCTSDLVSLLEHLSRLVHCTDEDVQILFQKQYHPYLLMAGVAQSDLTRAEEMDTDETDDDPASSTCQPALLKTLYHCFPKSGPIYMTYGQPESYDKATGQLRIGCGLNPEQAFIRATAVIIEGLWKESRMPTEFPQRGDTLARAVLAYWKQSFAQSLLLTAPLTETQKLAIISHFSPTLIEQKTLNRGDNQPILLQVKKQLADIAFKPSLAIYREVLVILATPIKEEWPTSCQTTTDIGPLPSEPQRTERTSLALPSGAQRREQISLALPSADDTRSYTVTPYYKGLAAADNRVKILIPDFDNEDETLFYKVNPLSECGYSDVEYTELTDTTLVHPPQVQGRKAVPLGDNQWHILPGLANHPQTRIVCIRVTPACRFELVQDRRTGLFLIKLWGGDLPGAQQREDYHVDFLIEPEPSRFIVDNEQLFLENSVSPAVWVNHHMNALCDEWKKEKNERYESFLELSYCRDYPLEDKLTIIETFLQSFETECDICVGTCKDTIKALFLYRPYAPQQKRFAFWLLATWFGIPARITDSEAGTGRIEISENGGFTWRSINLQGVVKNPSKIVEEKPDFPDIPLHNSLEAIGFSPDHTAEVVAKWLTYPPSHPKYRYLIETFCQSTSAVIAVDGSLTVREVQRWLEEYWSYCTDTERKQLFIVSFFRYLDQRATQENSEEIWSIHRTLTHFVVQKKWLPADFLMSPVHCVNVLMKHAHDVQLQRNMVHYYEGILTKEIRQNKGLEIKPNHRTPPLQRLYEATWKKLHHVESTPLNRQLMGEVPDIGYRMTPPGKLNLERMIQQQSPFQISKSKPVLRPAMIIAPVHELMHTFKGCLSRKLQSPDYNGLTTWELPPGHILKSDVMGDFYFPYIWKAFAHYLYTKAKGKNNSVKLLFPTVQDRSYTRYDFTDISPFSFRLKKPGWFKTANFEEFFTLISNPEYFSIECKSALMQEHLASQAFNQQNLCLLGEQSIKKAFSGWLEAIDREDVIAFLEQQAEWIEYKDKSHKKASRLAEHYRSGFARQLELDREFGKPEKATNRMGANDPGGIIEDVHQLSAPNGFYN
ncbi:AAA family ATPase [Parendozoicomonas sp. Alg238-R29]|uniref:AAA family ATPase n=1 Tax=Parendozoicomonas sp. Alg238-R29 TaxID=2993446 RepID=UPI00248E864F|nr:AAA family ATPase [Parendozoicomonas sp. Alg238-R29]